MDGKSGVLLEQSQSTATTAAGRNGTSSPQPMATDQTPSASTDKPAPGSSASSADKGPGPGPGPGPGRVMTPILDGGRAGTPPLSAGGMDTKTDGKPEKQERPTADRKKLVDPRSDTVSPVMLRRGLDGKLMDLDEQARKAKGKGTRTYSPSSGQTSNNCFPARVR